MYVSLEGLIGSGKTATARLLATHLGWPVVLERVSNHPLIAAFYQDPAGAALETELIFSAIHYYRIRHAPVANFVADFSPVKDFVFGRLNLGAPDWALFRAVYEGLAVRIPNPDLVVFLDISPKVALGRVLKRGRDFESGLTLGYLERLKAAYDGHLAKLGGQVTTLAVSDKQPPHEVAAMAADIVESWLARRGSSI